MIDATEAKELIDEAVERSESDHDNAQILVQRTERQFRDRVSLTIGLLAATLAVVHMAGAGAARKSILAEIEAADTYAYMQAKIVRETLYKTAAAMTTASDSDRKDWAELAHKMRAPDAAGHGIDQLQDEGATQKTAGLRAGVAQEGYETGEAALQMAIVLLSVAMIARSRRVVFGAVALAIAGIAMAAAAYAGLGMPWSG